MADNFNYYQLKEARDKGISDADILEYLGPSLDQEKLKQAQNIEGVTPGFILDYLYPPQKPQRRNALQANPHEAPAEGPNFFEKLGLTIPIGIAAASTGGGLAAASGAGPWISTLLESMAGGAGGATASMASDVAEGKPVDVPDAVLEGGLNAVLGGVPGLAKIAKTKYATRQAGLMERAEYAKELSKFEEALTNKKAAIPGAEQEVTDAEKLYKANLTKAEALAAASHQTELEKLMAKINQAEGAHTSMAARQLADKADELQKFKLQPRFDSVPRQSEISKSQQLMLDALNNRLLKNKAAYESLKKAGPGKIDPRDIQGYIDYLDAQNRLNVLKRDLTKIPADMASIQKAMEGLPSPITLNKAQLGRAAARAAIGGTKMLTAYELIKALKNK